MTALVARAVMKLAMAGMGSHRCDWAEAMRAEFTVAVQAREGLSFAFGCLVAAWRELPAHHEGRLALSRYISALGLILPAAALLLTSLWLGYPWVEPPYAHGIASFAKISTGLPTATWTGNAFAVTGLASLLLARAAGMIVTAWFVVDADWDRAAALQRAGAASTITLTLFSAVAFADVTCVVLPLIALVAELLAITQLRRWHDRGEIAVA